MSQLPVLGTPAASCVVRSAIDRCSKSGLPNVIGADSSAVGPAEPVSGVKSENRVPVAARTVPASLAQVLGQLACERRLCRRPAVVRLAFRDPLLAVITLSPGHATPLPALAGILRWGRRTINGNQERILIMSESDRQEAAPRSPVRAAEICLEPRAGTGDDPR